MTFTFRAHHPSAYFRFAMLLLALIGINLVVIAIIFPYLKNANDLAAKSIVLIVPWMLLLLLPSIVLSIFVYRSFVKSYCFTVEGSQFTVELLKKKGDGRKKNFLWREVKSIQIIDFEDNHYCNLKFADKKNDLVLHRESGDFEKFFQSLPEHLHEAVQMHD
jgi:hypothetical protein